jgi:hypothetical protein
LLLEIVDVGLQRLEILAASQHGERCNGSNLENRTLHNDQSPYWWLSSHLRFRHATGAMPVKVDVLLGGRNCNKFASCLQLEFFFVVCPWRQWRDHGY